MGVRGGVWGQGKESHRRCRSLEESESRIIITEYSSIGKSWIVLPSISKTCEMYSTCKFSQT